MGIFTILHWIATNLQANSRNAYNSFARNEHYELEVPLGYDVHIPSLRGARSATKQSSKIQKNSAFTLAEIMIVLSVIGILTAILLPAARQATPDENVIKFKKAHNAFLTTIRELVTSDKYYLDGDLSKMPNGNSVTSPKYLCQTIADLVTVKKVDCSDTFTDTEGSHVNIVWIATVSGITFDSIKSALDVKCKNYLTSAKEQIVLQDGVVFYDASPTYTFSDPMYKQTLMAEFAPKVNELAGAYEVYKVFCIDVDGFNKGEDPFGYGIRLDGKILNGARADAWLNKSIQGED